MATTRPARRTGPFATRRLDASVMLLFVLMLRAAMHVVVAAACSHDPRSHARRAALMRAVPMVGGAPHALLAPPCHDSSSARARCRPRSTPAYRFKMTASSTLQLTRAARVVSVPLVAHGHLSARGHPVGRPGWCGTAVGGTGWLAAGGRRDTIISGNPERVRIR